MVHGSSAISATRRMATLWAPILVCTAIVISTGALSADRSFAGVPPRPTVTAITPTSGPTAGGTSVNVAGTNFVDVTAINFGTKPALSFSVDSATELTAISPAESPGTVDVTVTTTTETSVATTSDHFSFVTSQPLTQPSVAVTKSSKRGVSLHVTFPTATFVPQKGDGQNYVEISEPGMGDAGTGSTGEPEIPVSGTEVALPQGACRPSVKPSKVTSYTRSNVLLWPIQPPTEAGAPTNTDPSYPTPQFTINQSAYEVHKTTPHRLTSVGAVQSSRGLQLTNVSFYGAEYTPAKRKIRVITGLNLNVKFRCKGSGTFGTTALTNPANLPFDEYYASTIANWNNIVALQKPTKEITICTQMLIVTSTNLLPAAQTFAQDKESQGISAIVATTDGPSGVGTTATEVRNYILNKYDDCSGPSDVPPSYVTLMGDTSQVPTFELSLGSHSVKTVTTPSVADGSCSLSPPQSPNGLCPNFFEDPIATDAPYGYMNQDQASLVDGQKVPTGFSDFQQDLFVGRMPASNLTQAQSEVGEIITQENTYEPTGSVTGAEFFQPCDDLGCAAVFGQPDASVSLEAVTSPSLFTGTVSYVGDGLSDSASRFGGAGVIPNGTTITAEDNSTHTAFLSTYASGSATNDTVVVYKDHAQTTEVNGFMATSEAVGSEAEEFEPNAFSSVGLTFHRVAGDEQAADPGLVIDPEFEGNGAPVPSSINWQGGVNEIESL